MKDAGIFLGREKKPEGFLWCGTTGQTITKLLFKMAVLYELANTVYTRVQVECVYKSNPIFEAKNTTFLEKV